MVIKNYKGEYVPTIANMEFMAAIITDLIASCGLSLAIMNAQHEALDAINKGIAEKAGLPPQITPEPPTVEIEATLAAAIKCIA